MKGVKGEKNCKKYIGEGKMEMGDRWEGRKKGKETEREKRTGIRREKKVNEASAKEGKYNIVKFHFISLYTAGYCVIWTKP